MNPVAWREDLCSGSDVCKHDSSEMGLAASPSLGTASQCACRTFWLWSQYLNLALCTGAKRKKKKIVDPQSLAQIRPKPPRALSAVRQL